MRLMKLGLLNLFSALSILLLISTNQSTAQTPQRDKRPRTASISGRVTINGKPAANVRVILNSWKGYTSLSMLGGLIFDRTSAGGDYVALTDADGRYRMANLPEGGYELRVMLRAYIAEKIQATYDDYLVRPITLHRGEAMGEVDFVLARCGVITGRVTDGGGRPLVRGRVQLQVLYSDGRTDLYDAIALRQMYETDDRGVYRIYGVRAGRYLVSVDAESEAEADFSTLSVVRRARTWHPDTNDMSQAKIIEVKEGGEATGVDIRLVYAKRESGRAIGDATGRPKASPNPKGVITGRITADGRPLAGARVFVSPVTGGRSDQQAMPSDEEGAFNVTGLQPGSYSVMTLTPDYVSPSDLPRLRIYRTGDNVTINLVKTGAITGRVTDEFGEPIAGVQVVAQKLRTPEGQPDFDSAALSLSLPESKTDDRGVYRIFGLEPGVYVVYLNVFSFLGMSFGHSRGEPSVYHPSSTRNEAAEVTVPSGGETGGVDIRLRAMRGHSISGAIKGEMDGGSFNNAVIIKLLRAADKEPVMISSLIGWKNFSLSGVEDGVYDLIAIRGNGGGMILGAGGREFSTSIPRRVTVNGADVSGIDVKLLKPGSIEGRVVIEPSEQSGACRNEDDFSIGQILLNARRDEKTPGAFATLSSLDLPAGMAIAAPGDEGAFVLKNIEPGRVRIETDLPAKDWYIRAITRATSPKPIDISRSGVTLKQGEKITGIEMTIAHSAASLSGKIVPITEGAQLPKRLRVHLIPAETAAADYLLRYAEAPVRGDGSFDFKHMAPGKYLLHTRQLGEKEANDGKARPVAWVAIERAKLRREAEAAKNEIELKACQRVNDYVLRW